MSWELCFEVSIDLFNPVGGWSPNSRVRAFRNPSEIATCTCEEIIRRKFRNDDWSEKFTLKIICLGPASLGEVFNLLREDKRAPAHHFTVREQKKIMSELKQCCECDRHSLTADPTIIRNECGLLDADIIQDGGLLTKFSQIKPISMILDRVLRPTPSVLLLARLNEPETVRKMVNDEVKKIAAATMKATFDDDKPGFVYIMQRTNAPEYIKIGYSRKDTAIRHDALQACAEDLQVVARTNLVPNAAKIEKLVHAELMYFRRWHDCAMCGKEHREWFEMDPEVAKQVILRWSQWLASEPYDRYSGDLKDTWRKRLFDKTTDNLVLVIRRILKDHLEHPVHETKTTSREATKAERIRDNIRAVTIGDVENETSRYYSPPNARKRKRNDSEE